MTEAIKFPGTEMEVIEKYPLSRRLDHPDFGDVNKTTFAVGKITDFEKISDNPIQVKSRVKVEVDGQEFDYLPLFFHPKPLFWDAPVGPEVHTPSYEPADKFYYLEGDDVLATDYNKEEGYFEKAWQSFKIGDEVAVMLKEGIPVAVVGFADGIPRVGEDVIEISYTQWKGGSGKLYIQCSKMGLENPDAEKGPDGLELGLTKTAEKVTDLNQTWVLPTLYMNYSTGHPESDPRVDETVTVIFQMYIMVVGPILYVMGFGINSFLKTGIAGVEVSGGYIPPFFEYSYTTKGGSIATIYAALYSDKLYEDVKSLGETHNGLSIFVDYLHGAYAWYDTIRDDYLALGFVEQPFFENNLIYNDIFFNTVPMVPWGDIGVGTVIAVEFATRPHTKAELQAAGMWPAA